MDDRRKVGLISVWNKTGLIEFAEELKAMNWIIYASGGTSKVLKEAGFEVIPTEKITGISSLLGGRVKTLHPALHAAILAAGDDREAMIENGEPVFDMVAVDLYPFNRTADMVADDPELVELIDIGGPAMLRAAGKNWAHVISAAGTDVYAEVIDALKQNADTSEFRRRMAARTFDITSQYDMEVSVSLERGFVHELRYGENPHQSACVHFTQPLEGFAKAEILGGKPLSYNNYMDASAAWDLVSIMPDDEYSAILMKHGNPCGAGIGDNACEAFTNAFRADRVSPYGGILALNRRVDYELVAELKGLFLEIVLAPEFEEDALERLRKRRKLRILKMPPGPDTARQTRSIWGGLLFQDADPKIDLIDISMNVSEKQPSPAEIRAMDIAWRVCRSVKSNAIVIADEKGTLGVGAGQMSRIESLDLAIRRAEREGNTLEGAVLASDGFFPFRDGPDRAAEAGISAIVQPGGSMRDNEVIEAVNEHGISMIFTGIRHFRH